MAHSSLDHLQTPRKLWWFVIALAVLTLVCGSIGVARYEAKHSPDAPHGLSPLYHAAQMLILHTAHFEEMNGWLEAGRWLGAATLFATTAVLFGKRLRREFQLFLIGFWKEHHVVCGLGQKGLEIARCILKRESSARVLVIDLHPEEHLAHECEKYGIGLLVGDASIPGTLRQARVSQARQVIVVTPEDQTNVRIAMAVQSIQSVSAKATCHVHVSDIHLREALQQWSEEQVQPAGGHLHFFDVFDNEARRMLLQLPLDGAGISKDDRLSVHIVILGFGRMGRSIASRAAKMGHFANGKPLRISVIDRNAELKRERLLFRYPALKDAAICHFEFHTAEADSITVRDLIEQWANEPDVLLHTFICLDDDARNVEVALRLRSVLTGEKQNLLVRIHSHKSLAEVLEAAAVNGLRIIPFGMVEDACSEENLGHDKSDIIAHAIHERFVEKRLAGSIRRPESDPALRDWVQLREEFRESNRQQADHIAIKLRAIGCELKPVSEDGVGVEKLRQTEIEMLARVEHERWTAERRLAGWSYGTPSNKEKRLNENLVNWDDLPESIRNYDEEAVADIPVVLQRANPPMKIVSLRRI